MARRLGVVTSVSWGVASDDGTSSARAALGHTVEVAAAAESLGLDGFFVRVHHFEQALSSPFPLLGALAVATRRIQIGTAVLDMRYENPFQLAEAAAVTDLLSAGRLQLGVGAGAPEIADHGAEAFGYVVPDGFDLRDLTREKTELLVAALSGVPVAQTDPSRTGGVQGHLAIQPQSPGVADRVWWGATSATSAEWAGSRGLNLMSAAGHGSSHDEAWPEEQARIIDAYHRAWSRGGWADEPQVAVVRTLMPAEPLSVEPVKESPHGNRPGRTHAEHYAGPPDELIEHLLGDPAVAGADWLLVTVPGLQGVDQDVALLRTLVEEVTPSLGLTRAAR